ncbi:MAG: type II toxin-antitoxin system HicA family toxin [Sarcina sp.]
MSDSKKNKKLIPKDYKNINKYISSPEVKKYINEVLKLSQECKSTITDIISNKFVDFMTPIEDIIQDLFNDLSREIMRRYEEVYKTTNLSDLKKNLKLISNDEIHKLYEDIENEILSSGKIILEKSNTFDDIYTIYNNYLTDLEKVVMKAAKFKILAIINHLEFIQLDTKNYINNIVQSISKEAFDLYSEEMDRYFLDTQSFVNNNNLIMKDYLKKQTEILDTDKLIDIDDIIKTFDSWILKTDEEIKESKNKIFTHYRYQELNKLAQDNGYMLTRVTGGHGIFINDTGLVVVIPQGRDIGKGLQIRILKSIGLRD